MVVASVVVVSVGEDSSAYLITWCGPSGFVVSIIVSIRQVSLLLFSYSSMPCFNPNVQRMTTKSVSLFMLLSSLFMIQNSRRYRTKSWARFRKVSDWNAPSATTGRGPFLTVRYASVCSTVPLSVQYWRAIPTWGSQLKNLRTPSQKSEKKSENPKNQENPKKIRKIWKIQIK